MTPESRKLYKLIILYFLSLTKQPMSNAIISDFILTNNYTDYFSIQETLTNLLEDDMIESEQTHATSYYKIKPAGQEILTFFGKQLPDSTKAQIRKYLSENRVSIVENTSIHTDYTHVKNKEYIARCSVYSLKSPSMYRPRKKRYRYAKTLKRKMKRFTVFYSANCR